MTSSSLPAQKRAPVKMPTVIRRLVDVQQQFGRDFEELHAEFRQVVAVEGYSMERAQSLLARMDAVGELQARLSGVLADLVCSPPDSKRRADALLAGLRLLKHIEVDR